MTVILWLIAAVLCFFGGGSNILWLCIAGFVLAGISVIVSFLGNFGHAGATTLFLAGPFAFAVFFKDTFVKWITFADNGFSNAISGWILGNNAFDVFYAARVLTSVLVVVLLLDLYLCLSSYSDSHGN